jgi:phage shock protein A
MTILGRMGQSISRTFDSLLDGLEDPRRSIEQTLKEMREQLRAARREVVSSVAAEKQLRAKVEELTQQAARWGERAELAVRSGDDDLARAALLQRRRVEGERERAERLRGEQMAHALDMKSELERMERRIGEIEARKGTLAQQVTQARRGGGVESLGAPAGGSAFSELRRLEAEIDGVELAVQAQREVDEALRPSGAGGLSPEEVEARFRQLEAGQGGATAGPGGGEVEEELQAIKRKFRIGD